MGKQDAIDYFRNKFSQPLKTIQTWNSIYWIFFCIVIPGIQILVYNLPTSIKKQYFIFNTTNALSPAIYISHFTHSSVTELSWNLMSYFICILAIFAFERSKKVFQFSTITFFLVVPFLASGMTFWLWNAMGRFTEAQGFSGFVAAFSAYAFVSLFRWVFGDVFSMVPKWNSMNIPQKIAFVTLWVLLALSFVMLINFAMNWGEFKEGNGYVSNGIAHMSGFLIGLIAPLIFRWNLHERELVFDSMIGFSIAIVIFRYIGYIQQVIEFVRMRS